MKKTLIALALMGMSTSAFASKARVEALGQDSADNYFINDSRSIWYNVSHIHDYKDMVMMEWGDNTGSALGTDGAANPKAQGGFFRSHGDWTYGVHLGEESNTGVLLRLSAESAATALLKPDNVVDFFVGKDMGGMRWAANLLYSKSEIETNPATNNKEQTAMAVRLGVGADMWEAHANVSLKGESKTSEAAPQEFDGGLGVHVGGAYKLGAGKIIANYKTFKWDIKNATHTTAKEAKYNQIWLGYGHEQEVAGGKLFTQVYYRSTNIEASFTQKAELKHSIIPLTVGFEAKANEWLTWRGSVSTNLQGKVENTGISTSNFTPQFVGAAQSEFNIANANTAAETKKNTVRNAVDVAAGATLTFGKLTVDGMVGATDFDRTATAQAEKGTLTLDNLMTRVGVNYAF